MADVAGSTTQARREESKHVLYEIEMFCALARYFETGEVDRAVQGLEREGIVVRNAIIEAFQIHARQLIELLDEKQRTKDWDASDFTKGPWQFQLDPGRRQDWERFSQRVAHLSRKRARFTDKERLVETQRIRRELGADIEQFLLVVDEKLVCQDFLVRARKALSDSLPVTEAVSVSEMVHSAVTGATEPVIAGGGAMTTAVESISVDEVALGLPGTAIVPLDPEP